MKLSKSRLVPRLSVRDLLVKGVGGHEDARSAQQLHASDLTKQDPEFCPREVALLRLLRAARPDQYVQHAMRVTWDEGRDKQWRINNDYLRDYMVGDWNCLRCDATAIWTTYPDPQGCSGPGGVHLWEYEEPVFHHPSGFSGSLDGVVQFSPAKLRMLEVKIIKGDDFKTLLAPLAEHRVRTQLYLRLIAESPDSRTAQLDVSQAHVLYIMRGHGARDSEGLITPFREFIVERNDKAVERYVRMAHAVPKSPTDDMPEGVCSSALCVRAKKCSVAKECFSGKYPAKHKWKVNL